MYHTYNYNTALKIKPHFSSVMVRKSWVRTARLQAEICTWEFRNMKHECRAHIHVIRVLKVIWTRQSNDLNEIRCQYKQRVLQRLSEFIN
jgi:hypothetical protein